LKAIGIVALFSASIISSAAQAQIRDVQTITIQSAWGGLGTPARSNLVIKREGNQYTANQYSIRADEVGAFLKAIESPIIAEPSPSNVGITPQWLREHVEEAGSHAIYFDYQTGAADQKELFRKAFEDEKTIQQRLNSLYASFHTDDYPRMDIELKFVDGEVTRVTSSSQHPFMIPWKIIQGETSTVTYNADISRALLALLPKKFTNREALSDENEYATGLLQELAGDTGNQVKTSWEALKAQHKAGDALTILKQSYQVRRSDVNSYHNLDYGKEWSGGDPHEENLHVDLWKPSFPKNFLVAAVLFRNGQQTIGADALSQASSQYEDLVLSIGWLKKYWNAHPDEHAWLFYVHDRSFTEKAMRIFAADMKVAGREELIAKVSAVQNKAALLETGNGDYWIVLPDRSLILWRWQSLNNILLWKPGEFAAHECTEYATVTGGCAGTAISPDGKVLPN
jgi:hypothetical protein